MQLRGALEIEAAEKGGVDDAVTNGVRADAQRNCEDRGSGEPPFLEHQAACESQVLRDILEHAEAARLAVLHMQGSDGAHSDRGLAARLFRRQALADVVFGQHLNVGGQLLREIAIEIGTADNSPKPRDEPSEERHEDFLGERLSTRSITPATRSQFRASAASCFLPAFEMA